MRITLAAVIAIASLSTSACSNREPTPTASSSATSTSSASAAKPSASAPAAHAPAAEKPKPALSVVVEPLGPTIVRVGAGAGFSTDHNQLVAWGGALRTRTDSAPSVGAEAQEVVLLDPAGKLSTKRIGGTAASGLFLPSVAYGDKKLFVFGGWAPDGREPFDTLHEVDLATDEIVGRALPKASPWPAARNGGAMIYAKSPDRLILFAGDGGTADGARFLDDLWTYDIASRKWAAVDKKGPWPSERWHAAMTIDPTGTRAFMFGGAGPSLDRALWELDLASMTWRIVETKGIGPETMQGMSLTYDAAARALVIIGGLLNIEAGPATSRTVWVLDMDTLTWSSTESAALGRREHVAAYDPTTRAHYVLGGCTSNEPGNFYRMGPPVVTTMRVRLQRH
ncbi:MAG: hypothetical protein HOW73_22940 [Polyangiaceae bacterium]|nr:hypothetical protein [Polyangiaceae bacterium]